MEPTKEQLELATNAYWAAAGTETGTTKDGLLAAAPHLQLPWMDASREELAEVFARYNAYHPDTSPLTRFMLAMNLFVQKRNSELTVKVTDSRIVAIEKSLAESGAVVGTRTIELVLMALDRVKSTAKSYGDDHVG